MDIRETINSLLDKIQKYFNQVEDDNRQMTEQNKKLKYAYEQLALVEQELREQYEDLVMAEKELEYLSYHDQLTGLYNRRFFEEELRRLDVQRNLPISLMMMDVNGLKLINDSFGHEMGDRHLVNVANLLRKTFREDDIIARISGDEFIVILPNTSEEIAEGILERLIKLSKEESFLGNKDVGMNLSIAVGIGTKDSVDMEMTSVFTIAEDRMYTNKVLEGQKMRLETLDLMVRTIHERYIFEEGHANRVAAITEKIARELGLSQKKTEELKCLGYLHDVGKITIDGAILNKSGRLDKHEWEEVKKHPEIGYRILSAINDTMQMAEYILYHHERYDGKGYPKGLKGDEIPLAARIISIAEAYDSMLFDSPSGKAMTEEEVVGEFVKNAGSQFDPYLSKIFVEKILGYKWKKND